MIQLPPKNITPSYFDFKSAAFLRNVSISTAKDGRLLLLTFFFRNKTQRVSGETLSRKGRSREYTLRR